MAMNWQVLFGVSGFRGITKMENQMDRGGLKQYQYHCEVYMRYPNL